MRVVPFHCWKRSLQALMFAAGLLPFQSALAQSDGRAYVHNETMRVIHIHNALRAESGLQAAVLYSLLEQHPALEAAPVLDPPPLAQRQTIQPGQTLVLEAVHPVGHVSIHMLCQAEEEPLYIRYRVVGGEGVPQPQGEVEAFTPHGVQAPYRPFGVLDSVERDILMIFPVEANGIPR